MSLNMNGERLLAEALADAMNRDLEQVPSQEQLKQEHQFSRSFEREMRRLEKQTANGTTEAESGKVTTYPAKRWRRYGAWAAAFVCVVGLAAVAATGGLFHTGTKSAPAEGEMSAADGVADETAEQAWDDAADDALSDQTGTLDSAAEQFEDAFDATADNADDSGNADRAWHSSEWEEKATAPGWQEQLLAESAKADEWVNWSYGQMCDDGSIILDTIVKVDFTEENRQLRVSDVCDVYYEQTDGTWTRVYHNPDRQISLFNGIEQQGDSYFLSDLNMTASGTYRLVRQVNQYRQVLQLSVETD